MEEETIDRIKHIFPAHSALYHTVKGLIFMRGDFAHKVTYLYPDENDRNLKINNERRLKERLFKEIMLRYNARIDRYNLLLQKLSDGRKNDVEIVKFKLVESGEEDDFSGRYTIFPRTFVCSRCGDFRNLKGNEWNSFNPNRCRVPGCSGRYEQVSIVMFCEECGMITPLYYSCEEHGTRRIRLDRRVQDSLLTWRVVCLDCYERGRRGPVDIFRFVCRHKERGEKISESEEKKFKPLTIKEGGIYTPVVLTSVDIPPTESIHMRDLEYILLGLHLGKFKKIPDRLGPISLEKIESYYRAYSDDNLKELLSPELGEFVRVIEETIRELKERYSGADLESYNDYIAIKGRGARSYDEFIEEVDDETKRTILREKYQKLKERYGIKEITYIPEINLISSCIGIINGINKFYESGFVPHFNPIWKDERRKDKILVYAYPFETEGILIDLDKVKVCNWLIKNRLIDGKGVKSESDAKEILLEIERDTEAYNALKTLLHTLSHLLIRRSSLYTGLDSDSCGEMIFINPAAILIYSTSNINIGGFEFVFEHSLDDWFRDVEFEAEECTLDPVCIFENGACFSCLYLPEFVCTDFNHHLDRDVFLGKKRFNTGYWEGA